MHWSIYEIFTVLSGVVLIPLALFGSNVTTKNRVGGVILGAGFIGYGVYVAAQQSGLYYFPVQIFFIPVVAVGYLGYETYKARSSAPAAQPAMRDLGAFFGSNVSTPLPATVTAPAASAVSPEVRFCSRCGQAPDAGAVFCIRCGRALRRPAASAQTRSTPARTVLPASFADRFPRLPRDVQVAVAAPALMSLVLVVSALRAMPMTLSLLQWTPMGLQPYAIGAYVVTAELGLAVVLLHSAIAISRADLAARVVASSALASVALGVMLGAGSGGWVLLILLLSVAGIVVLWWPQKVRSFLAENGTRTVDDVALHVALQLLLQTSVLFAVLALGALDYSRTQPGYLLAALLLAAVAAFAGITSSQLPQRVPGVDRRAMIVAIAGLALCAWMLSSTALSFIPAGLLAAHLWLLRGSAQSKAWLTGVPGTVSPVPTSSSLARPGSPPAPASAPTPAPAPRQPSPRAPNSSEVATAVALASSGGLAQALARNGQRFHPAFARISRGSQAGPSVYPPLDVTYVDTSPYPSDGEREVDRWVATGGAVITTTDSGSPIDAASGVRQGRMVQLFSGAAELLLTDRRLVALVGEGDSVLGAVGGRTNSLLALTFPLDRVETISVALRPKTFGGGLKEGRLQIMTLEGTVASFLIDDVGAGRSSGSNLYEPYQGTKRDLLETLVMPVVRARRPAAAAAELEVLRAVEAGRRERTQTEYAVTFVPG